MNTERLQSIAAELAQRYGWRYTWDAMAHEAMLRVGEAAVYGGALREVMRPVVTGEAIVAVECSRSGHIVIRLQYVPSMCRTDERARELAAWACYAPPTAASYDEYAAGVRTLAGRTGWQVCADDAAQVLTLSRPYATVVTGCELAAALTYHTRGEAIVAVHTAEQQPVIRLAYIPTTT